MSALDNLIAELLKNRGLEDPKAIADFFSPPGPDQFTLSDIGLDSAAVSSAVSLTKSHILAGHPIAVYGDYDVDGLTATAVLWETLYRLSKSIFPHIPHRREEGYGLSRKGIDHCLAQGAKLIITVDNGIVAHTEIDYCRSLGCDMIIIDHHQPAATLPEPNVLLHSITTTAAGLTWFFCREYLKTSPSLESREGLGVSYIESQLELVALSVICDLIPLLGINRSFAKFGLEELNRTTRPGLRALFETAGLATPLLDQERGLGGELIKKTVLNTYHVGFVIGPRLNATGRLEHALDSLRLLCTTDSGRATELARHLHTTNQLRQAKTKTSSDQAVSGFSQMSLPKLLLSASNDYDEGVIGLIAAKLVETYHRPAIAVSIGPDHCKGSARSLPGFHITDHLRQFSGLLDSVGGHAMAAGFTVSSSNLDTFITQTVALAEKTIPEEILVKNQRIDAEVELSIMNHELFTQLKAFEPYGLGNPRPVFITRGVPVSDFRRMGSGLQHLKFLAASLSAIYFSAPAGVESDMDTADIVYSLDLNTFNHRETLQLVIKQLTPSVSPSLESREGDGR